MTEKQIQKELLERGLDDMLQLAEIADTVRRYRDIAQTDEVAIMGPTLEVIRDLLASGYAVAGDVIKGEGGLLEVRSWNLGPSETTTRIERAWRELGHSITLGDVVWLELTDAGRELARKGRGQDAKY